LIRREARGELKEASAHALGAKETLGEDLIAVEAPLSYTDVVGPL
jgi:hypothetical protein